MTLPLSRELPSVTPGPGPTRAPDLDESTLVTFYQPFYNLQSGRLQGLEALARLRGHDGRPQVPAAFFAAAEAAGTMRAIDLRILDDALAHLAHWLRGEPRHELILSVNLSWHFVDHPEFVTDVTAALTRYQVPADRLLVDLTTATFRHLATTDEAALARLCRLQEREISFCLDGFTAADLDVLPDAASVPVDIIKLHPGQLATDSGLLADLAGAVQDAGLPVVAAGVETRQQLDLVRELGFEWAQGFLLGEPTEADSALSHATSLPF